MQTAHVPSPSPKWKKICVVCLREYCVGQRHAKTCSTACRVFYCRHPDQYFTDVDGEIKPILKSAQYDALVAAIQASPPRPDQPTLLDVLPSVTSAIATVKDSPDSKASAEIREDSKRIPETNSDVTQTTRVETSNRRAKRTEVSGRSPKAKKTKKPKKRK
jgi:hypothetical protein